jgi:hypothetical protein
MGIFYAGPFTTFCPLCFFSGVGDFHAVILDDSYEVFDDREEDRRG